MICGKAFIGGQDYATKHLNANDYYEKGKTIKGVWVGKACEKFGVKVNTEVSPSSFELLRDNKHAGSEKQLTARQNTIRKKNTIKGIQEIHNRRNFYDFTFSAPKSFSVMAVTMGDDRILEWHNNAVLETIVEMENTTGRQDHKIKGIEYTGEFCAAHYKHDTNRALEPQLHDHLVIFNATPGKDGRNYAIESNEYFQRCRYLTALYRNKLANQACRGGYDIEFDQNDAPQIKGMKSISSHFSQRTQDIEDLIEQAENLIGSSLSRVEKKQITFASRGFDFDKFIKIWKKKEPKTDSRIKFMKQFLNAIRNASNSTLHETTTQKVIDAQWNGLNKEEKEILKSIKKVASSKVIKNQKGIVENKYQNLQSAIDYATEHHFERVSVIKDYTYKETVLKSICGEGYKLNSINTQIENQLDLNKIIAVENEFASVEHWENEKQLLENINNGHGILGNNDFATFKPSNKLNKEQESAVRNILKSKDQFSALIGKAGTGKTFTLSEIVKANVEQGFNVIMCAPSNGARDVLREDGVKLKQEHMQPKTASPFEEAISMQHLLLSKRKQKSIKSNLLIILDEAGLASTKQIKHLTEIIKTTNSRLLLVGDPGQHSSVEAGDALRMLLKYSNINRSKIKKIMRQKEDAMQGVYRQIANDLSNGRIKSAFLKLDDNNGIIEAKGEKRNQMMAKEYMKAFNAGNSVIVVNPTHRENDAISIKIREELKKKSLISSERTISTLISLGWTKAEKKTYKNYNTEMIIECQQGKLKGKHLQFQKIINGKGLLCEDQQGNNHLLSKKDLQECDICKKSELHIGIGDKIMLKSGEKNSTGEFSTGEIITVKEFNDAGQIICSDDRLLTTTKISYGYTSTSHKSQGSTHHTVLIGFDRLSIKHADRKIAYVAGTRGTERIKVFCENKLELWDIEKRKGNRKSVMEMMENANFKKAQYKTRIASIVSSLERYFSRIKNRLFNIKTKKKEEHGEKRKEKNQTYNQKEMKFRKRKESKQEDIIKNGNYYGV